MSFHWAFLYSNQSRRRRNITPSSNREKKNVPMNRIELLTTFLLTIAMVSLLSSFQTTCETGKHCREHTPLPPDCHFFVVLLHEYPVGRHFGANTVHIVFNIFLYWAIRQIFVFCPSKVVHLLCVQRSPFFAGYLIDITFQILFRSSVIPSAHRPSPTRAEVN